MHRKNHPSEEVILSSPSTPIAGNVDKLSRLRAAKK